MILLKKKKKFYKKAKKHCSLNKLIYNIEIFQFLGTGLTLFKFFY